MIGEVLEYREHDYFFYDGAYYYHFISTLDGRPVRWGLRWDEPEERWRQFFEEIDD